MKTLLKRCLTLTGLASLGLAAATRPGARAEENKPSLHAVADPSTTIDIVDALKAVVGNPKGVRATFAKGQCVRGTYTPSPQAPQITRSLSFTQPSNIIGRFAMGGGNPAVPDTTKTVLRGFSMKLGPEGHVSDLLTENAPVHFAKNIRQMLAFLRARVPGPDGKPDHDKIKAFSDANPETLNQAHFIAGRPLPGSFAGTSYWAVHAFPATNAKNVTRFIKFRVVPVDGEVGLSDDDAKSRPADFLFTDLQRRVDQHGVRFDLLAVPGRPTDPVTDLTVRWPDEDTRPAMKLGRIEVTALEANETCDGTIFDPGNLADGIGQPPDEIFAARRFAYIVSLTKRRTPVAEK
jgi:catalase